MTVFVVIFCILGVYLGLILALAFPQYAYHFSIFGIYVIYRLIRYQRALERKRYKQIQDYNKKQLDDLFIQYREAKS